MAHRELTSLSTDYLELREATTNLGNEVIGKSNSRTNSKPWWNAEICKKYRDFKNAQKDTRKRCDQGKVGKFMKAKEVFLESYHSAK